MPRRKSKPGSSFVEDNTAFEAWLADHCSVVETDLDLKHTKMQKNAFIFLRATYFRWARRIETLCPELAAAPAVLSVGDVHLENFGTWRDNEGRLVWGINDFDEAAIMPYPFDLVRLVASAELAPHFHVAIDDIAALVLEGYRQGLDDPHPTLLDRDQIWMRAHVGTSKQTRDKFWEEIDNLPDADPPPERDILRGLLRSLPKDIASVRFARRTKGGGGLGRPRYIAEAAWRGGHIVREAKALVPSAWTWAHGEKKPKLYFLALAEGPYRSPDPWLTVRRDFVYRRIAPDSRKLDLDAAAQARLPQKALTAMGFDLGAIHAARKKLKKKIFKDLDARPDGWLAKAARRAAADVRRDFKEWKRHSRAVLRLPPRGAGSPAGSPLSAWSGSWRGSRAASA